MKRYVRSAYTATAENALLHEITCRAESDFYSMDPMTFEDFCREFDNTDVMSALFGFYEEAYDRARAEHQSKRRV